MSASTWGNPNATKRVLLLHGLTSSSLFWHRVAQDFASRDFFVVAPDLLGHGNARRGSDYSITALVDELQPFFTAESDNHPYDVVVGHSLGAIVASALFPLLKSTRSVRVLLVDPPLEQSPELVASIWAFMRPWLESLAIFENYQEKVTLPTKEDTVFGWSSTRVCDIDIVDAVLDQNVPWSFSHLLLTPPSNVRVSVLAADPSKGAAVKEEDLRAYPWVTSKTVWGISHLIPIEAPQAVIEAALERTEAQNQVCD